MKFVKQVLTEVTDQETVDKLKKEYELAQEQVNEVSKNLVPKIIKLEKDENDNIVFEYEMVEDPSEEELEEIQKGYDKPTDLIMYANEKIKEDLTKEVVIEDKNVSDNNIVVTVPKEHVICTLKSPIKLVELFNIIDSGDILIRVRDAEGKELPFILKQQ